METTRGQERFFNSTRGKVVQHLRQGLRTVNELAEALELTDNAVRAHLAALERDGMVTQGELRRGVGKPAFTYDLTPAAEHLFPKAYGALMRQLLDVLGERLEGDTIEAALREVGRRVAGERRPADGNTRERLELATEVLGDLGGLAEAEPTDTGFVIHGCSCPLAAIVEGNPEACVLAEEMLSDLLGVPVRQVCDQGPPARCRFEVPAGQQSQAS